jgi:peptidoglycan hydrolase CwlO-like protein
MPLISLAKALKLKNRLAGRLSEYESLCTQNNSLIREQYNSDNVGEIFRDRNNLKNSLTNLKLKISSVNGFVYSKIQEISELKSDISFYKSLPTSSGVQKHYSSVTEIVYCCHLNKQAIMKKVAELEKQIDTLQDQIDEYNVTTKIEIDQAILDLGS